MRVMRSVELFGVANHGSEWRPVLPLAVYFSLWSATRIGWRELNVGTRITAFLRGNIR
jgi:hypothetical protein